MLEKTLESPLDCEEIKPINAKGDQSWIFTGRVDVEAEAPIHWEIRQGLCEEETLRIGKAGHGRVLQAERTAWVRALRQEDIYWTENQPVWLAHSECTWGDARQRLIYAKSMDLGLDSKSYKKSLKNQQEESWRLDLFFRAQSAVGRSCCLPAYSCQTLCNPADGSPPAPLSMEFSRQEYWSGFSFSSFISLLHSVTVNILFLFQSLFILLMLGLRCCEWAYSSYSCCAGASHCSGFSCFGAQALDSVGFRSFGSRALGHRLSRCGPWA